MSLFLQATGVRDDVREVLGGAVVEGDRPVGMKSEDELEVFAPEDVAGDFDRCRVELHAFAERGLCRSLRASPRRLTTVGA